MYPNLTCWLLVFLFSMKQITGKMFFAVSTHNPYAVFSTHKGYLDVFILQRKNRTVTVYISKL